MNLNKIIIKGGANSIDIDIDPPVHEMYKNDLIIKVINTWKQIAPAYVSNQIYRAPLSRITVGKKMPRSPTFIAVYYTRGFIQKTGKLKLIWSRKWIDC